MANYRDFEMLNNAIQNLGEGALKRRQLDEQSRREMERMAMEREIRGAQMKLSQQAQANSQYNADRAASARAESDRMKIINDGRGDSLESEKLDLEAMKFAAGQDEKRANIEAKQQESDAKKAEADAKAFTEYTEKISQIIAGVANDTNRTSAEKAKYFSTMFGFMPEKIRNSPDMKEKVAPMQTPEFWDSIEAKKKEKPENTGTTTDIIRDDEGREIKRVTRPNEVQQILKPSATEGKPSSFASESDARASGSKTGDIVYIRGVGKVRLK